MAGATARSSKQTANEASCARGLILDLLYLSLAQQALRHEDHGRDQYAVGDDVFRCGRKIVTRCCLDQSEQDAAENGARQADETSQDRGAKALDGYQSHVRRKGEHRGHEQAGYRSEE